jgi:hypothetical protein
MNTPQLMTNANWRRQGDDEATHKGFITIRMCVLARTDPMIS